MVKVSLSTLGNCSIWKKWEVYIHTSESVRESQQGSEQSYTESLEGVSGYMACKIQLKPPDIY